jgi:hypothetical protein
LQSSTMPQRECTRTYTRMCAISAHSLRPRGSLCALSVRLFPPLVRAANRHVSRKMGKNQFRPTGVAKHNVLPLSAMAYATARETFRRFSRESVGAGGGAGISAAPPPASTLGSDSASSSANRTRGAPFLPAMLPGTSSLLDDDERTLLRSVRTLFAATPQNKVCMVCVWCALCVCVAIAYPHHLPRRRA